MFNDGMGFNGVGSPFYNGFFMTGNIGMFLLAEELSNPAPDEVGHKENPKFR